MVAMGSAVRLLLDPLVIPVALLVVFLLLAPWSGCCLLLIGARGRLSGSRPPRIRQTARPPPAVRVLRRGLPLPGLRAGSALTLEDGCMVDDRIDQRVFRPRRPQSIHVTGCETERQAPLLDPLD